MSKISNREYKRILRFYNIVVPKHKADIEKIGEEVLGARLCRRLNGIGTEKLPSTPRSRKRRGGLRRTRKQVAVR